MMRQLLLSGATFSLVGLLVACSDDGRGLAGITPVPGIVSGPHSQAAPGEGTFLIDLSTGRWTRVLPTLGKYLGEVSPDGKTVLYTEFPAPNSAELFAVEIDGSNRRKIADGPPQAAFSPDGKTLAMWGFEQPLTLMDWPDGEPAEITLPATVRTALWSPTNALAVLTAREISSAASDLYLVSRGGAAERVAGGDFAFRASPRWAPDGSRLAFAGETSVFTVTPGEEADVLARFRDVGVRSVSWSSDGALLAVGVDRRAVADPRYEATDIVVIDAATGERRFTLVSAGFFDPLWSPVEPVLLFDGNACRFEDWQLMLVNGDGTNLRPLTERHSGGLFGGLLRLVTRRPSRRYQVCRERHRHRRRRRNGRDAERLPQPRTPLRPPMGHARPPNRDHHRGHGRMRSEPRGRDQRRLPVGRPRTETRA